GEKWVTLGRNLIPDFGVTIGVRRTGHGLPESNRWDVFWDAPLNHPDEVRRATATFRADRMEVKTDGARLEAWFPGLSMGAFSGGLRFTVYRGLTCFVWKWSPRRTSPRSPTSIMLV